eukprot:1665940-Pyramimonas_sp.AAC.1
MPGVAVMNQPPRVILGVPGFTLPLETGVYRAQACTPSRAVHCFTLLFGGAEALGRFHLPVTLYLVCLPSW